MIDRVKGAVLAFVVWLVALWTELREAIYEARHPKPKKFDPEHVPVFVPPEAGPLVQTPESKDPLLLAQVPIQSTKAQAKKAAHRYAEERVGHPLPWKKARKLMAQWEREEKALMQSMAPEYAETMAQLSEAATG